MTFVMCTFQMHCEAFAMQMRVHVHEHVHSSSYFWQVEQAGASWEQRYYKLKYGRSPLRNFRPAKRVKSVLNRPGLCHNMLYPWVCIEFLSFRILSGGKKVTFWTWPKEERVKSWSERTKFWVNKRRVLDVHLSSRCRISVECLKGKGQSYNWPLH